LTPNNKQRLAELAKKEFEVLNGTIHELNLYLHAAGEIGAEIRKQFPGQNIQFDARRIDAMVLHEYLGLVDTSIPAIRRLKKESDLVTRYQAVLERLPDIKSLLEGEVLMPQYKTRPRIVDEGVDLTLSERKLRTMNHYQLAKEALDRSPDSVGIEGMKIDDLVKAVEGQKVVVQEEAKFEKDVILYSTTATTLQRFINEPLELKDPAVEKYLKIELSNASRLTRLAEKLVEYAPEMDSAIIHSSHISTQIQDFAQQFYEHHFERIDILARAYLSDEDAELHDSFEREAELLIAAAIYLRQDNTTALEFRAKVKSTKSPSVSAYANIDFGIYMGGDVVQGGGGGGLRSFMGGDVFKGEGSSAYGGGGDRRFGSPTTDFGNVTVIQHLDPTPGVIAEVEDGKADLNWPGLVYGSLATISAIAEASGMFLYMDPDTQEVMISEQVPLGRTEDFGGTVDLIGMVSKTELANTRGNPRHDEETYWRQGMRYSMGVQKQMLVTTLGVPGSGLEESILGTGTSTYTLKEKEQKNQSK
jgi:hypothetical protein